MMILLVVRFGRCWSGIRCFVVLLCGICFCGWFCYVALVFDLVLFKVFVVFVC